MINYLSHLRIGKLTVTLQQSQSELLAETPSQKKRREHKEQFAKIGAGLREYWTGNDCQFDIKPRPVEDKELTSRLCGPQMKTQQFERTSRN